MNKYLWDLTLWSRLATAGVSVWTSSHMAIQLYKLWGSLSCSEKIWVDRVSMFTFNLFESMSKFVKILVRFISYENRWCDHEFFFFTQYYWSYLIRLADKTEKYWCVNIFFIGLKPHFLAFLPVQRKKNELSTRIIKKNVIFSGIVTGCIDKSIIKVNVGGFNMWFFITFFAFFCQKTSVPSVYVKTVTLDKLQK